MGKREKNQARLLTVLRQCGQLSVADAVAVLRSSEATVRRYFGEMEARGLVIRICGGVRLDHSGGGAEYHFDTRAQTCLGEKREIGRAAAGQITDHDRIFFDSGTTVRECGNVLAERLGAGEIRDLAVVTNSLVYNEDLARRCPVSMIGGTIRMERMDLCGMTALAALNQYRFTKAFLGVDGISEKGELSTTDEDTSLLARTIVERSKEVLILADSGKLRRSSFAPYAMLRGEKFTLITDDAADPALLKKFSGSGVRIILAGSTEKRREKCRS